MSHLLASFQIAYVIDIACLLILLLAAVSGARKGFVKCFFGFVSTIAALILAVLLASVVLGWLDAAFSLTESLGGKFETAFLKIKGFGEDISADGMAAAALEGSKLPGFVKDAIAEKIAEVNTLPEGTTLASLAAPVVAKFVGMLISGVIVFTVARLLLLIVEKILSSVVRSLSVMAALNTLLGFVAGALKTLIGICLVLAILSLIPVDGITSFFDKTLVLRYLYNDNPLTKLLGLFIKF